MSQINVIDLFAGPGGLGEGFSAYSVKGPGDGIRKRAFKIGLSVEMDRYAHQTLLLRSFVRQFGDTVPAQYYDFYRGEISLEELKAIPDFQNEWRAAEQEVGGGPLRMGHAEADKRVEQRLCELLEKAGRGDRWVVIGGPPCQAFSSVGRVRNMAKPDYRQSEDERIYAYIEYLKILDQVQPDCFILENVEGMLQTSPDGEPIFPTILGQLKQPSEALLQMGNSKAAQRQLRKSQEYIILQAAESQGGGTSGSEYLVPIVDYGVPQDRKRVILIGVRKELIKDLDIDELPRLEKNTNSSGISSRVSVVDAIGDLPKIRSKISTRNFYGAKVKSKESRRLGSLDCFINGFLSSESPKIDGGKSTPKNRVAADLELPRKTEFPVKLGSIPLRDEYVHYRDALKALRNSNKLPLESGDLWHCLLKKNAELVSSFGKPAFSPDTLGNDAQDLDINDGSYLEVTRSFSGPEHLKRWLKDPSIKGVRNHESREHKGSDLLRYLYFATYSDGGSGKSKKIGLSDIPAFLQPDHANAGSGHFSDRFRVQVRGEPAKTITCHLGKDGHAFIHYDPVQCRALSVREAARLQTFPDNYIFCGPVSEQRKQVGNAVPPWFALQLAELVFRLLNPNE